ncbi:gamma-glutamylcyclotransferase family protein [Seleniivibrio woodruffii]|uniref:gamma-glutamylcyclotransferase family protein n=1 Tax=Seleniivibrio woodruffii TaxID=1078050 RepID=UPI0026EC2881|nr:gamma-glutamylcyclotransferase family protein [Seleniivibrio woodruffii]
MVDNYSRDHRLYFAYGADMLDKFIKTRCFAPEFVAAAKLTGFRLAFFGYSHIWDGAQETLVPDAKEEVWGAVYRMSSYDGQEMDAYQDVRLDGAGQYFHYPVVVTDAAGNEYYPLMYRKNILGVEMLASKPYMDIMIAGAAEKGLPENYIERLKSRNTRIPKYDVPLPTMPRRVECAGCDDLLKKIV